MPVLMSRNEPETLAVGRAIGALLASGDIVAIDGPLGAGKTRLVRGIALGLGLPGSVVSSPTYVMVNEYALPEGSEVDEIDPWRPRRLFHVDAYRLAGPDDLDSIGWDRVVDPAAGAAVAVEWADRVFAGEGGTTPLLDRARAAPSDTGEEPSLWRVRMEPVHAGEDSALNTAEPEGLPPGLRRITVEPPTPRAGRRTLAGDGGEAWRDWQRLAKLLAAEPENPPGAPRPALPTGWTRCPSTGRAVPPDSPTFPFADNRARMADLGRWMTGAYAISREIRPEDESDADIGHHPA